MPLRNLGALALVATLALSACSSDDPKPQVAPETSATPSTSTSPSPTPPEAAPSAPEGAAAHSSAGAGAFASHFVEVLNFAQRTGVTEPLRQISDDACAACSGYIAAIDEAYAQGGSVSGGQITHERFRELPADYGAEWGGYAEGRSTAQVIDDGGGKRTRYPGGPVKLFVYTSWSEGGWVMKWMRTPS